jgi:pilus assembly protein CpaE
MYPLRAILVGHPEAEAAAIRGALANLAVIVDAEFTDADQVIHNRDSLVQSKYLFVARVNAASDLLQIRRLLRAFPGNPILALLNQDSDLQGLLTTQRAGAIQIAFRPLQSDDLQAALETITLQLGINAASSKAIVVCGVTEGAGATSLAVNLANEIATVLQIDCVLVELSPGMGNLATYLDLEPRITTRDLLTDAAAMELPRVKQALSKVADHLHVLAGPYREPSTLAPSPARVLQLIGHLRRLADVVVLDMPYDFGQTYLGAFAASDQILLVGEQTVPSVHDLRIVRDSLEKGTVDAKRHYVISRFDFSDDQFSTERLKEIFQTDQVWPVSNDRLAFRSAMNEGKTLRGMFSHSAAVRDVQQLAAALFGLNKPTAESPRFMQRISQWFSREQLPQT